MRFFIPRYRKMDKYLFTAIGGEHLQEEPCIIIDYPDIFQALQMFPSEETYCKIVSLKHAMVIGSAFENEIIKFRS